ncbi:MAG: hypothetical protein QOH89_2513, partial [Pseudonocardiales bacterium]|nr:hypothetical protein [Pseudonocardiales bacterium]
MQGTSSRRSNPSLIGVAMWHHMFVAQIPLAEKVLRT